MYQNLNISNIDIFKLKIGKYFFGGDTTNTLNFPVKSSYVSGQIFVLGSNQGADGSLGNRLIAIIIGIDEIYLSFQSWQGFSRWKKL